MYNGKPNASSATGTRNRVQDVAPYSGICSVCLDGCPGSCEIGKSSYRAPQKAGIITAETLKSGFGKDFSKLPPGESGPVRERRRP